MEMQIMTPALLRRHCEDILSETDEQKLRHIITEAQSESEDASRDNVRLQQYRHGYNRRGLDESVRYFQVGFVFALPSLATQEDFDAMIDPDETPEEFDARMAEIMADKDMENAALDAQIKELQREHFGNDAPENE